MLATSSLLYRYLVFKDQCTKLPKRIIQRSEYQDSVDINDNNIKANPHYYKRRQAICEHPFGTIKRHWGYTHTLLKSLQKVNEEMNLIMFCYSFLRTKNILGFDGMLKKIANWIPAYNKVICTWKNACIRAIYSFKKPFDFLKFYVVVFNNPYFKQQQWATSNPHRLINTA